MATTLNSGSVSRPNPFSQAPGRLVPGEALGRCDHRHEVHAFEAGPFPRLFLQPVKVEYAVPRMRDHGIGHAFAADQRGQRAGIDAGQADDAARLQPQVEMAGSAVVRGI